MRLDKLAAAAVAIMAASWAAATPPVDPFDMDLSELMEIKIVSHTKAPEELSNTPAAVFVLTREDIRSSAALTVPDLLRLVPGIQVAQLDAHSWAVTSRGFNDRFNNKLLILIDGRSVFNPLFNGVYWDSQLVPLHEIERIEIIRGPGGTLWETKAVNGVINIITRNARYTRGGLLDGGAGTEHLAMGEARYGWEIGEGLDLRLWGSYNRFDDSARSNGSPATDAADVTQVGFRMDWEVAQDHAFDVSGAVLDGHADDMVAAVDLSRTGLYRIDTSGDEFSSGYVLGRWQWNRSDTEYMSVQAYYDYYQRQTALLKSTINSVDVDLNHRLDLGKRHTLNWGLGYRSTQDNAESLGSIAYSPPRFTNNVVSAYLQDAMAFADRFHLTLGVKAEHNSFTEWEFQPTVRFVWNTAERQVLWGAATGAVRTPTRSDAHIDADIAAFPGQGGVPILVHVNGTPDVLSEETTSYELGYRIRWAERASFEIASFYSELADYVGTIQGSPVLSLEPPPPHLILPYATDNVFEGHSYGAELTFRSSATPWWHLVATYSWLRVDLDAVVPGASPWPGNPGPEHQANLRSTFAVARQAAVDLVLRYVDDIPPQEVPAYFEADLQVSWQPTEDLRLSIIGRNLLHDQHPEFQKSVLDAFSYEVERSLFARVTWEF